MAVRLYLLENVLDLAVRTDYERRARHAHNLFAIHVLFLHDSERVRDFLLAVGEQAERQIVLFLKFLLGFRGIRGYPKQHHARLLHLFVCVAEPASFNRSSGSVGARKKVKHHGLAAQVLERDFFSVLILQSEVGSFIIDFHGKVSGKIEGGH